MQNVLAQQIEALEQENECLRRNLLSTLTHWEFLQNRHKLLLRELDKKSNEIEKLEYQLANHGRTQFQ